MLEILLVIFLCKKLGAVARDKGRKAGWYQAMLVAMWICGEVTGGIVGVIATDGVVTSGAYLAALIGATVGAAGAFAIVGSLSKLQKSHPYTGGFPVMQVSNPAESVPDEVV